MSFTNISNAPLDPVLIDLGLHGNPFATSEAEQERDILGKFFVDIDHYDRIKDNQTQIIFAPRGCGKTTLRVLRANEMAPIQSLATAFAIEFTYFDGLYAKLASNQPLQTQDYVNEILRLAANAIFSFLFEKDANFKKLKSFSIPDRSRLARLLGLFSPSTLVAENLYSRFTALLPGVSIHWEAFCAAIKNFRLYALLENSFRKDSPAEALAFLADARMADHTWLPISPKEQLAMLVDLIHHLGYQTLVVLFDRVDEIPGTANRPEIRADLLCPLLANLPVIEAPEICYKFFLPSDMRNLLLARSEIRRDRLHDLEITVEWPDRLLRHLLERRLKALAGITELDEICGAKPEDWPVGEKSLGETITDEMVELSQGSPRHLILAGQLMLETYSLRHNREKIIWEDWENARVKLIERIGLNDFEPLVHSPLPSRSSERMEQVSETVSGTATDAPFSPPILYISKMRPEARIQGKIIRLTENEFSIFESLISHKGTCHVETLHDEVWQNAITPSGVNVAISRLRNKILDCLETGRPAGESTYLEKKSKFVMLHNFQVEEE